MGAVGRAGSKTLKAAKMAGPGIRSGVVRSKIPILIGIERGADSAKMCGAEGILG
jgi:hypothetical protein